MMRQLNAIAPQLDGDAYAEFYELRKAASTMTKNTMEWFADHAKSLLEEYLHTGKAVSVLSVGSGEGDIDTEFIRAILPHLNSQKLQYDALEPNPLHYQRFMDRLNKLPPDKRMAVSVHDKRFEEFNTGRQYDIVLLVHVLYYFDDPYPEIRRALSRTKPGGRVIIVHQSSEGIPEIQRRHMYELKNNENEILTGDDIRKLLDEGGEEYLCHHIDAELEVTECLRQSEAGLKIMSFCMECDLRHTDQKKLECLTGSFSELAKTGKDGTAFIYEPLDVFQIKKKAAGDDDPVEDYRQLAQKFAWAGVFRQREKKEIRLLDVACGTGRWSQAFRIYVNPQLPDINISYDVLDPSEHSIMCFLDRMESPLEPVCQYGGTIQETELPADFYDIIWSMHGFYAIPRSDLGPVLTKIHDSLADGGEAFIAQPAHRSFYIEFYKTFLDTFNRHENAFTSAEDITETLNMLGFHYRIHIIRYEECIARDDPAALEHYILTESVNNSFMREECEQKGGCRKIVLEDILENPELGDYLRSFIKKGNYCFPQEIWLISFGKKEKDPKCPHDACHGKGSETSGKERQGNPPDPLLPGEKEMYDLVSKAMRYIVLCQSDTDRFPLNGSGCKWVHSDDRQEYEKMLSLAKTVEEPLPEEGEADFEKILQDVFHRLAPHSTNDNSGGYLAYIPGGGLFHSALADFISLSLNRYVTMFMAAPGLAAIEEQVVRWFCDIAGFPKEAGGVLTSGGAAATFTAVHAARTKILSPDHFPKGTAYVSSETHLCVEQSLVLCGFPKENVRKIAIDENFRIRTDLLAERIEEDRAAGFHPFLLVANAGTTNTGAVDDLRQAGNIARKYRMWFHVDAAYGGFFMLTGKGREQMKGIERADSLALDPHKSLFLPYGTGALLVKNKKDLLNAFRFTGSYLPPSPEQKTDDALSDDIMYLSPEVTRDFRGLRIWLPLKMLGISPFRRQLEEKLELTQWVLGHLSRMPGIQIISRPQLSIIAFKLMPPGSDISPENLDRMNTIFLDAINQKGNIFLSPFRYGDKSPGHFALRMAILSHRTGRRHLQQGIRDVEKAMDETLSGLI